ncbi:MAG TPA: AMP-binding protein [Thermoanaerobaculia bacterium]|nr:AMP-binding protein [Thermoanaerobaculia bacterium]
MTPTTPGTPTSTPPPDAEVSPPAAAPTPPTAAGSGPSAAAPVPDYLTAYAAVQPDKPAIIEDRPDGTVRTWSYADLNRRANRLANALLGFGLRPRESVLWCGLNSHEVALMGHAARKSGITSVPMNYRLSPEEAAYVVDNSDALLIWTDTEYAELFQSIRAHTPKVREIVVFGGEAPPGTIAADDFVRGASAAEPKPPGIEARTVIYTSGTTGKPKGAVRTGQGNPEQLKALLGHVGYRPDDIYLTTGPLYHSGPGGFMGIAFLLGNTTVIQRRFDPEDWLRVLEKHRVTSTFSAPTPIRRIVSLPEEVKARYDRSSLRVMIANAAPWPFTLKQAYVKYFPPESLWEVYGSTELGVNMVLEPKDQITKPGSCGKPAPMVEVRLLDDEGKEVTEPRVPGEIYVSSPSIFDTYHKAHDKYEAETRGELHTVGDVAYFDEEGFYYICDRKKDMIISGGMNIYPAEIEAALEAHPSIYEAAVFGVPSEEWGESVHAVVVVAPGEELDADAVIAFARQHLAGYKCPRSVSFLDELPKVPSGKILKRELREPYWKGRETRV